MVTVAAPIARGDTVIGAVAVSVSLRGISQLQRTAGLVALISVLVAIAGITLLIHLRARQLILEPLSDDSPRHGPGSARRPLSPGERAARR